MRQRVRERERERERERVCACSVHVRVKRESACTIDRTARDCARNVLCLQCKALNNTGEIIIVFVCMRACVRVLECAQVRARECVCTFVFRFRVCVCVCVCLSVCMCVCARASYLAAAAGLHALPVEIVVPGLGSVVEETLYVDIAHIHESCQVYEWYIPMRCCTLWNSRCKCVQCYKYMSRVRRDAPFNWKPSWILDVHALSLKLCCKTAPQNCKVSAHVYMDIDT